MSKHLKSVWLGALLLTLISPTLLLAQGRGRSPVGDNAIDHEPVLVYQVSGGTIAGQQDLLLTVYDDGQVVLAVQNATNPEGAVCIAQVDPLRIARLQDELAAANAARLNDGDPEPLPDLPLTTVTFFFSPGNSPITRANTFSYFFPEGDQALVEDIISSFIAEVFPEGCPAPTP